MVRMHRTSMTIAVHGPDPGPFVQGPTPPDEFPDQRVECLDCVELRLIIQAERANHRER